MNSAHAFLLLAGLVAGAVRADDSVLRDIAAVREAVYAAAPQDSRFELEATVTYGADALGGNFAASDGRASVTFATDSLMPRESIVVGDRLRLGGRVATNPLGYNVATVLSTVLLSHGKPPEPRQIAVSDLARLDLVDQVVRFEGTVFDVFPDETDRRFVFLILVGDDDATVYVPVFVSDASDKTLTRLIDARIGVTALAIRDRKGSTKRKLESNVSHITPADITELVPPPVDPFDVPELAGSIHDILSPRHGQSRRRRIRGEVVAVWGDGQVLLRREGGEFSEVVLLDGLDRPRPGAFIEAVGAPDTDLYHLNLSRARWRPVAEGTPFSAPVRVLHLRDLLSDGNGRPQIGTGHHGCPVRITGVVAKRSDIEWQKGRFSLSEDGFRLIVDASAAPAVLADIEPGARVEVTATCIVEIENWRPQVPFPRVKGCVLAVRSPADVKILAHPPWWTTRRLFTALGSLLVILFAFFVWNRILNRVAERRGHQLLREQIERAKAKLKTEERTRLAVELHDSLAQSLSGAAMEVETAVALTRTDPGEMLRHLILAERTLQSCRDELRNSLWDLRSRALEETDLAAAIRRTLSPHMNLAHLNVRFAVSRARLSDNLTHALLRIVREFTLNALRHGKATAVQVAGRLEGGILMFSVTDNGCGFDPDDCPGILQGHFGLEGVRERIASFGGSLDLRSAPGRGTKARVTIPLSAQEEI